MNAIDLLDEMQTHLGVPWQSQRAGGDSDTFLAGDPYTEVSGVITSWSPTVDILRQAIKLGHNTVISRQSPFYSHGEQQPVAYRSGAAPSKELLEADPVYRAKRDLIVQNKLVVIRFSDNWDAREEDGQLAGLTEALAWDKFHVATNAERKVYRPGNNIFQLPAVRLGTLAKNLAVRLKAPAIRVMGREDVMLGKTAVLPGFVLVPDLETAVARGVDLIVTGEVVEWEGVEYLQDAITAGRIKGAILLGSEVSEGPGSGKVAAWLKTFLTLPVVWIPTGTPFTSLVKEIA